MSLRSHTDTLAGLLFTGLLILVLALLAAGLWKVVF